MPQPNKRRSRNRTSAPGQLSPGDTELEFGVPFPGVIVESARWTRTALHRVPVGVIDWRGLFGRDAPITLDIGCGNGRSTLCSAIARPESDHLAVDTLPVVIRYATRRANQRGLSNIRWAVIGGRELLTNHVAPQSISAIHIFHPQPYAKQNEAERRLVNPDFLSLVFSRLRPGGRLVLQTDHSGYWEDLLAVLPILFHWHVQTGPWPEAPAGMTRRELQASARGLPIYRGWGTVRTDLTPEDAHLLMLNRNQ